MNHKIHWFETYTSGVSPLDFFICIKAVLCVSWGQVRRENQGKKHSPGKGSNMHKEAELWNGPAFGKYEKDRGARVYGEEVVWAVLQMRNLKCSELTKVKQFLFCQLSRKYLINVSPPPNHSQQADRCWWQVLTPLKLYYQTLNFLLQSTSLPAKRLPFLLFQILGLPRTIGDSDHQH